MYLGDCAQLKKLLPHPKAAICVSDYKNIAQLVKYLQYLSQNETAYDEHRAWRRSFDAEEYRRQNSLLRTSWQCSVCQWAAAHSSLYANATKESLCRAQLVGARSSRSSDKDLKELAPFQLYSLVCLLVVFLCLIARFSVKLWCPQWFYRVSSARSH